MLCTVVYCTVVNENQSVGPDLNLSLHDGLDKPQLTALTSRS